ncbi:flippase-like domain-containing protein [Micrococcales bacterium 31B]|nr:flippase-like domain-containing protein [Micrococcales bacterium 31B]
MTVVVDEPTRRVRHPYDLIRFVTTVCLMALTIAFGMFAHATTAGVETDVQQIANLLNVLLRIPAKALQTVVVLAIPLSLVVTLVVRSTYRRLIEAVVSGLLALTLASLVGWAINEFGDEALQASLQLDSWTGNGVMVTTYMSGICSMLTVIGTRSQLNVVKVSWSAVWITLGLSLISGDVSITAMLLTVLLGRAMGLLARYVAGSPTERAYGQTLVDGIERAGVKPERVERVNFAIPGEIRRNAASSEFDESAFISVDNDEDYRVYLMHDADGRRYDVTVLDQDRQVADTLSRLWRQLRLRGPLSGRASLGLQQSAEHEALMTHFSRAAGVRTPAMVGVAAAGAASIVIVTEHVHDGRPLSSMSADDVSDELLDEIWRQIATLHRGNIAHRAVDCDSIMVSPDGLPWLMSLHAGEIATTTFAQRVDVAQTLTALAVIVGQERSIASGLRVLGGDQIAAAAPLLQTVLMPRSTRNLLRQDRKLVAELRSNLQRAQPLADIQPQNIVRFGPKSIFTAVAIIVAAYLVLAGLGGVDIVALVGSANLWWIGAALACHLLTYVGGALSLMGFTPGRIKFGETVLAQVAGGALNIVMPAGMGNATINAQYLRRRGISASLAVATVGMAQISAFLTTVITLVVMGVVTGTGAENRLLPSRTVIAVVFVVLLGIATALLFPKLRTWVWARIGPTVRATLPRIADALGQPRKVLLGFGGNLLILVGFISAFYCCLQSFGHRVGITDLSLVYMVGNTIGSVVPTPGGLGAMEAALSLGLQNAGLTYGVALSATLLFRIVTFWLRVPFGAIALRFMRSRDAL